MSNKSVTSSASGGGGGRRTLLRLVSQRKLRICMSCFPFGVHIVSFVQSSFLLSFSHTEVMRMFIYLFTCVDELIETKAEKSICYIFFS